MNTSSDIDVLNRQIGVLASSITLLTEMLGSAFPLVSSQLQGISNTLNSSFNMIQDDRNQQIIEGRGHRATILKEIATMFPDKRIDQYIENNLPQKFGTTYEEISAFSLYVTMHLDEITDLDLNERSSWLLKTDIEKPELSHHGGHLVLTNFAELATSFCKMRLDNYCGYNNNTYETAVILRFENQLLILRKNKEIIFYLYVPVEDCWVKTKELQYLNLAVMRTQFADLLVRFNLHTYEGPINLEPLIDKIIEKIHANPIYSNMILIDEDLNQFRYPKQMPNYRFEETNITFGWYETQLSVFSPVENTFQFYIKTPFNVFTFRRLQLPSRVEYTFGILASALNSHEIQFTQEWEKIPFRIRAMFEKWIIGHMDKTTAYLTTKTKPTIDSPKGLQNNENSDRLVSG